MGCRCVACGVVLCCVVLCCGVPRRYPTKLREMEIVWLDGEFFSTTEKS